jgi:hypothetical protein
MGIAVFFRCEFEKLAKSCILAPVSVHNDHPGKGIGQALINHDPIPNPYLYPPETEFNPKIGALRCHKIDIRCA